VLLAAPEENATKPMTGKPRTLLDVPYAVDQIRVSPDGTRVAYMSLESGNPEIWVAAFPSFADRHKIAGGTAPLWRGDGKELVFDSITRAIMAVDVKTGPAFAAGLPRTLFSWTGRFTTTVHDYAMTSDGKRFLMRESPAVAREEIEPMHVILNWPSLLGK
jgi:Tol biopolymer transport system component